MESNKNKSMQLLCSVEIDAAAAESKDGEKNTLPKFSMLAYTGSAMKLEGWRHPVIIDLAGMTIPSQNRPIRLQHSAEKGVGHTLEIKVVGNQLLASGIISRETDHSRDVISSSKNGFPWQASVGARADQIEFLTEKQTAEVNGQKVSGPINIARKSTLGEISFVDLGADGNTSAIVIAKVKENEMSEKDTEVDVLDAEEGANDSKPKKKTTSQNIIQTNDSEPNAVIIAARNERARQEKIAKIIADAISRPGADLDQIERISAEAIDNRWTVQATELAILRACRSKSPAIQTKDATPNDSVFAAALLMTCGVNGDVLAKDRDFGEKVVESAWKRRGMGLHALLASALEADGVRAPHGGANLFNAVVDHHVKAGFSTVNLPGIVGTVGNKLLLNAFTSVNAVYPRIAKQSDFNNFLTHTAYRLNSAGTFDIVAPSGEIKHANLSEESYTNRLDTRGQMVTLTRQHIVNDDLNAFNDINRILGRNASLAVEKALIELVCESSDVFYTSARGNRLTSSALSITTLGTANAALMQMAAADGEPIFAEGKIVLVPPALMGTAKQLFVSTDIVSDTTQGNKNPWAGLFRPETTPYLASSAIAGSSSTTWYMLADPEFVPAFEVAYLQGRRQPTFETADAQFNTLGMQMRCYFDFGVAQVDYRGAIKATA